MPTAMTAMDPAPGRLQGHAFEDHTSEVRVRLRAPTLAALFVEAAVALAELFAAKRTEAPAVEAQIALQARDRDALLVDWLNELIYRSERARAVFTELDIRQIDERSLEATIRGHEAEGARYAVKAATFHGLAIEETPDGYVATVVLDV